MTYERNEPDVDHGERVVGSLDCRGKSRLQVGDPGRDVSSGGSHD